MVGSQRNVSHNVINGDEALAWGDKDHVADEME